MKRLVCVVEGKGDVEAVPTLCSRILHWLGVTSWVVEKQPIWHPRSKLVDMTASGPGKPCRRAELDRVLQLAAARDPDAVLILCDADDECPGLWSASVPTTLPLHAQPVAAVMAVREYESWLLWSLDPEARADVPDPELVRDAKGALTRADRHYKPSTHQLPRTRGLDIPRVAALSRSFNKLVHELARVCGVPSPVPRLPRPVLSRAARHQSP